MGKLRRLSIVLCCALPSLPAAAEPELAMSDHVVETGELVAGQPLTSYANEWWKWAYSMPQAHSPVRDTDGSRCAVNQQGPVWYLAGGFGTSKIHRTCTVPGDRHIFFPVINMIYYAPPGATMTCADARRRAAQNNNDFVYIRVFLDGEELEGADRFRLASTECFDLLERVPERFGAPVVAPSATDGFWIMLKPLPPGPHRLEFQAFYTNNGSSYGDMVQNISYDLTVLPGLQ